MSFFDFNTAESPRPRGGVIPNNTVAQVVLALRFGGHGPDRVLKASSRSGALMLDCEFTVMGGPHDTRKFWSLFVVDGDTEGHAQAAGISRGQLRAIVESARGINPLDTSPEARAGRQIASFADLDGMVFTALIGVEKGKPMADGSGDVYDDKNILSMALTPEDSRYIRSGQQFAGKPASQPQAFKGSTFKADRPAAFGGGEAPAPKSAANGSAPAWG